MSGTLRLGTRGSRLALWQAHWVRDTLAALPDAPRVEIVEISTSGDRIQHVALSQVSGQAFFTKEIEAALLEDEVDVAVHSLKDLATDMPDGLLLGAVMPREDPRDALLTRRGGGLAALPEGARVGTSSLRRRAFIKALRPDVELAELRGNVPTRVQKLEDGEYDALILATAGLVRLGMGERIDERLDPAAFTPAPAQGTVGVQIRADDETTARWIRTLDHGATRRAIAAERRLLQVVEGGCQVPVGALTTEDGAELRLRGRVASLDGTRVVEGVRTGTVDDPVALGEALGRELLSRGAGEILDEIRGGVES